MILLIAPQRFVVCYNIVKQTIGNQLEHNKIEYSLLY